MKRILIRIFSVLILLAGAGIMLYPIISNSLYEKRQNELTEYYEQTMNELPKEEQKQHLDECNAYNQSLRSGGVVLTDPFDESQMDPNTHPYVDLLNMQGDGSMGILEIPKIKVKLMIYHGTSENVLQKGVGHLEGTSLPVGGSGTHVSLSAHSGLPDKELFTNLDQLVEGDIFYLYVLGETLAYEVNQIHTVLPNETNDLLIDSMQDYVTLITCTPYGINSHRLLVRGTRIPYEEAKAQETKLETPLISTWQTQYFQAIFIGIGIVIIIMLPILIVRRVRRRYRPQHVAKQSEKRRKER
ncbi:MAG: class C sortase [Clostridiales bacterium]|nr:class C sortase [Clostridiales bacterium]